MSTIFILTLVAFFGLAVLGMPVAFAMFIASIGYLIVTGRDVGLFGEQILNGLYDSFVLLAVPLFILAANIMNASGVSDRLFMFCQALVGRFRGGLAQVDILVSIIFSGMSGSAIADAAGPGKLVTQMMIKQGRIPPGFAVSVAASSATIGPIIPPSIPMVIYAVVSDTSVGYLFLAGIIPGLIMGLSQMALVGFVARKRNFPRGEGIPLSKLPATTYRAFPALLMPVILLYCIYGGATTPTEAAAIAAAYALILAVFFYRELSWKEAFRVLVDSSKATSAVALLIAGALIFNYIVASERLPEQIGQLLRGLEVSPLVFLLLVNLLFLLLGCLFDATTMLLVLVPLFLPAARALGIDMVHFGVVIVVNIMIGMITPPYGVLLFVMSGLTGIALRDIIREIWAFIGILIAALLLMIFLPDVVLWLPRYFGYNG
ncbi:TRAP transporter large permease [Microvirga arabica]|uniref:TRAP transporter large permease n=1 Tax=Microvirga arabica TaxID=1128671 RepID=UPI00193A946D|nr:TRAP transporter large permease [Microvirga arabica]MBM1170799.1 TRAP transporter large permease [Microvirga arabica]